MNVSFCFCNTRFMQKKVDQVIFIKSKRREDDGYVCRKAICPVIFIWNY